MDKISQNSYMESFTDLPSEGFFIDGNAAAVGFNSFIPGMKLI